MAKNQTKPKIYVIVGPTASGKTAYSIKLAQKVKGEIISADSRQVYKGLDIGSGKVTKREMAGIPHHLLDVANPKRVFTVADFKKLAEQKIEEIIARGKTPIIVGGTGFYIQAIVNNLILPEVKPDKKLRAKLTKKSITELFSLLEKLDPRRASEIDTKNPVRLIRAIEVAKALGNVPLLRKSDLVTQSPTSSVLAQALRSPTSGSLEVGLRNSKYDFEIIGIKIGQDKLNAKIHKRLAERMKRGLVGEVKKLHENSLSWRRLEELGLEYRYLARLLQNKITKQEMLTQLEREIIKYSKRQMTWFKKDQRIKWREI